MQADSMNYQKDNLYEQNIPVNTGIYMVKSVEAADEECVYKTEYSQEELKVKPDQLLLLKIMVLMVLPLP